MPNILLCLLTALQLLASSCLCTSLPARLHSGEWLRLHVVAADDTSGMQALKLTVRDAVQTCYAAHRCPSAPMQAEAERLLPRLAEAAEQAARAEGFTGEVRVTLGREPFDDRILNGIAVPAGEYPALMIRLGDARGQNWWGLLDPELALLLAAVPGDEGENGVVWDWSLEALLRALLRLPAVKGAHII